MMIKKLGLALAVACAFGAGLCATFLGSFFGATLACLARAAFARVRCSFFFKALIGLAFLAALRGCFAFDLRFALTILTSSSPVGRQRRKKRGRFYPKYTLLRAPALQLVKLFDAQVQLRVQCRIRA